MKQISNQLPMQLCPNPECGLSNPRVLAAFVLCAFGIALGVFSATATSPIEAPRSNEKATPPSFRSREMSFRSALEAGVLPPEPLRGRNLTRNGPDPLGVHLSTNREPDFKTSVALRPATPAITTSAWSITPSANAGFAPTSLSAVTCVSASDCWAIGRAEIGQTYANTVFMHWDGNSWTLVPSPSLGQQTNGIVDITCNSSTSCWAVGYYITLATIQVRTLTLHWNGIAWTIVPSPNIPNGFNALYGVDCTADSNCWAVGFENSGSKAKTLVQKWDGTAWTIQSSPNPGTAHNVLNGVTCLTPNDCRAVGYSGEAGAKSPLVVQWNGTTWTATTLPRQPNSLEDVLRSVTCNSTSDCWAAGDSYDGTVGQPLVERWNGTSWTNVLAPSLAADNFLFRVACVSASDCWAVGNSNNSAIDPSQVDQGLILHWNGLAWLLSVPATINFPSTLEGVACGSGSECWAVGDFRVDVTGRPLIQRWNGTLWTSVAVPDVPAKEANFLSSVACVSNSDCWAVGFDFYGTVARTVIEHWDGTAWAVVDSPNTAPDRNNYLSDVTCLTGSDCWAIGQSSDTLGRYRQALAMHWNGTAWSIMNPSPADTSSQEETTMEGIFCLSSSDCWTVGFGGPMEDPRWSPWIQHWNGAVWTTFPAPAEQYNPLLDNILYDVTCVSTSDCWAVGAQGTVPFQTMIDHWDGTSWSAVPSPDPSPDTTNTLSSVTCVSATDCWAVGGANDYTEALIEHWDGSAWSIVPLAEAADPLSSVTCLTSSDCWAAGPGYSTHQPAQTLLLHWNGSVWTKISSPNADLTRSNNLSAVTCMSSESCWAVGQYSAGSRNQTLILRYAPSPALTSVVSRKIHGAAGPFDVDLAGGGIECRSGGASGDYTVVFKFADTLTNITGASITAGAGNVSAAQIDSADAHNYIVNLTGVANAQTLTVRLANVQDSFGHFSSVMSSPISILVGDTNGDGSVNSADISQTKVQSGSPVDNTNFREDLTTDGNLNSADIALVKSKSGTALP